MLSFNSKNFLRTVFVCMLAFILSQCLCRLSLEFTVSSHSAKACMWGEVETLNSSRWCTAETGPLVRDVTLLANYTVKVVNTCFWKWYTPYEIGHLSSHTWYDRLRNSIQDYKKIFCTSLRLEATPPSSLDKDLIINHVSFFLSNNRLVLSVRHTASIVGIQLASRGHATNSKRNKKKNQMDQ